MKGESGGDAVKAVQPVKVLYIVVVQHNHSHTCRQRGHRLSPWYPEVKLDMDLAVICVPIHSRR